MGIFSLFGKKDRQQETPADDSSRAKRDPAGRSGSGKASGRTAAVKRDTRAAHATAMKIDAIESEMSSEFIAPTTTQPGLVFTPPDTGGAAVTAPRQVQSAQASAAALNVEECPSPMGPTTQMLLGGATMVGGMAVPASEPTPIIEEAAILFANGQNQMVEQMLRAAVAEDNLGNATHDVWGMLFDLYQVTGKQQEFESLSLEYANKFETSPPAWVSAATPEVPRPAPKGATPSVPFSGKLDSNCVKQLERVQKLAETHRVLRLEFNKVTDVDPVGCGLLLKILTRLQKSEHDLILVGAPELARKIRSILEVGRRDETEAPWLLLLEILRLLNQEQDFEEVSIDYCVTFEVSPPAFVAPRNKVTMAVAEAVPTEFAPDIFMMPPVVEGQIDQLILALAAYADEHDPAIIDCARLARVDFSAASRLLTGMAPMCVKGRTIEFQNVNYLVAALFSVIGLKDLVRVLPRKS